MYLYRETVNTVNDFDTVKSDLYDSKKFKVKKKEHTYYNISCAFDIETTSFYEDNTGNIISVIDFVYLSEKERKKYTKRAIMYVWQLGINGICFVGRTWEEFIFLLDKIADFYNLNENTHLVIYIHNLSYEFQFMKNWIEWDQVFATKPYEPLYAQTDSGIIFKCSYRLTNKNLNSLSDSLFKYPVKKMVGYLDYNILRHSRTPLTDKELLYCVNDIKVVMAYIQEQIETEKKIYKIPLTNTGYVRRDIKEECLYTDGKPDKKKAWKYKIVQDSCRLTVPVYEMCRDAFQGGFVHAGSLWSGEPIESGMESADIISAYPGAICAEMYPMSAFKPRRIKGMDDFEMYLKYYCCLFTITFYDIDSAFIYDSYISRSRCLDVKEPVVNNGRIVSAKELSITITEQDYFIIKKWYKWESMSIHTFYTAMRGYLPKPIIKCALKYYKGKSTLKDVPGKEYEYLILKMLLNSIYGCMVTNIYHPEILLENNGEWTIKNEPEKIEEEIDNYNNKYDRCLYYPWGVWITAHVRRRICDLIYQIGEDFIYSDTDSIKFKNPEENRKHFKNANNEYFKKLCAVMAYHNIDISELSPANQKGEKKTLGLFEIDGKDISLFKTLGAKRYLYKDKKGIHITVAGMPKEKGLKYLLDKYGEDEIFDAFKDEMTIPALETGKLTHTYIDKEITGIITDYKGNMCGYKELSYIHLAPCDFTMSMSEDYANFLSALRSVNFEPDLLRYAL